MGAIAYIKDYVARHYHREERKWEPMVSGSNKECLPEFIDDPGEKEKEVPPPSSIPNKEVHWRPGESDDDTPYD